MNGLIFYRRKAKLTRDELSALANVSTGTIMRYEEEGWNGQGNGNTYLRIADVLGTTIDELLRDDLPNLGGTEPRYAQRSKTENPNNCLTVYRMKHRLTFDQLGQRIGGVTRERARQVCSSATPSDIHILAASNYEGMSEDEFVMKYAPENIQE